LHPFDHALAIVLVLVQPVWTAFAFRRLIALGHHTDRVALYKRTGAVEWGTLAVLAAGWLALGRDIAPLGLVASGGMGFVVGCVLVLALLVLLVVLWRRAHSMDDDERARQVAALGRLVNFLPRTARDYRHFAWLSVTAGIVEEILYRGFLIWYFDQLLPLWAAVVASSIAFGIGHSYQGPEYALRTGLVGAAFAVLYLVSGSLWLPIAAHAAVDLLQGATIYEILRRQPVARL
jgi:membrane protease YdiL (CAAX protease family)